MFGVTADESGEESAQMLQEFVSLQKEIFSSLELHFRLFYFINFVVWCVCENTSRHASPFCVLLILQSPWYAHSGAWCPSLQEIWHRGVDARTRKLWRGRYTCELTTYLHYTSISVRKLLVNNVSQLQSLFTLKWRCALCFCHMPSISQHFSGILKWKPTKVLQSGNIIAHFLCPSHKKPSKPSQGSYKLMPLLWGLIGAVAECLWSGNRAAQASWGFPFPLTMLQIELIMPSRWWIFFANGVLTVPAPTSNRTLSPREMKDCLLIGWQGVCWFRIMHTNEED